MNYRFLIWDFDGTLVDSLELALCVYRELQQSHGLPPIDDPEAVRDLSLTQFVKQFEIPVRRVPRLFTAFLTACRQKIDTVSLNDGIREVLTGLHEQGLRHAVISSNSKENIQLCLQSHGLEELFEFVIGTSRIHGKTRGIRKALKTLGHSPPDVLYVGDEIRDVEACRAIPLDVAAVEWGLNSAKALQTAQPTFQISKPEELWEIVGLHHPSMDR